jgi:hypothetical protein
MLNYLRGDDHIKGGACCFQVLCRGELVPDMTPQCVGCGVGGWVGGKGVRLQGSQ